MLSPKWFAIAILFYMTCRMTLAALSYVGDSDPESRRRALRHFDEAALNRGIEYHRAGFAVSIIYAWVGVGFLAAFILSGASSQLAERCLAWSGGRAWGQVILYVTAFGAISTLVSFPFDYYFGFVIERRFGFNPMSFGGWFAYWLKNLVVAWVILVFVVSLAYAVLRHFPRGWPWMIPALALALQFLLTFLFPRLLLPIFYKIERIENPDLLAEIERVADRAGIGVKTVYLINASQYSSHTNAFFTGFGKFKEIYLYDTLLKDHSHPEVAAILAHELGHWKHNHVLKGLILSEGGIILACALLYFGFPILARAPFLKIAGISDIAALPLLLLIAEVASFYVEPVASSVSRAFEREADRAGLAWSPSREVFIRDFKQLALSNHSNLLPHPWVVFWRFSHPPILERIESVESATPLPQNP